MSLSRFEPEPRMPMAGTRTQLQGIAFCGNGDEAQLNIMDGLLAAPDEGLATYDKGLQAVADETNKAFLRAMRPVLAEKRRATGLADLQVTATFTREGDLQLRYAWQTPTWKRASPPQWVLGGRAWLALSRGVYRLTHRKPRLPEPAARREPAGTAAPRRR